MKLCDRCKNTNHPVVQTYTFGLHLNGKPADDSLTYDIDLCQQCVAYIRGKYEINHFWSQLRNPKGS